MEPAQVTRAATIRCVEPGRLALAGWFLRDTLGLDQAAVADILERNQPFEILLDRHRLARFERAMSYWGMDFEFEPPFEQLRRELGSVDPQASRVGLRIRGPVSDRIRTIRLVRQLTQLPLREARRVIERGLPFLSGLQPAEASEHIARFAALGTKAETVDEGDQWIAFDPRDPRRGQQPLTRLSLVGNSLVRERGQLGAWTIDERSDHETEAEAEAAAARERQVWIDAGKTLAESELELLAMVSPREPSLEAALREGETPALEAAQVYADWLQERGDPRGQLASLQLARATLEHNSEAELALRREIQALISDHRSHIFGPFAPHYDRLRPKWHAGFATTVTLSPSLDELGPYPGAALEQVLSLPVLACVRSLILSGDWLAQADLDRGFRAECVAWLRELRLTPSGPHDLSRFDWSRFASLRRLHLLSFHGGLELGAFALPRLDALHLQLGQLDEHVALAVHNAALPALRKFELVFSSSESPPEDLEPLATMLSGAWASSLRVLGVHRRGWSSSRGLIDVVLDSPASEGLERVEFHDGWMAYNVRKHATARFQGARHRADPLAAVWVFPAGTLATIKAPFELLPG